MKIRKMLLLAPIILLAFAVACNGDSTEEDSGPGEPTATPIEATQESPEAKVPQEIIDAIDTYIHTVGLSGEPDERSLVTDCGTVGALCLDPSSSTISDTQAIIVVFANQSDASWEVSLAKEDGAWTVTGVKDTGCC